MFPMIYAWLGLLYFRSATRTVVALRTSGRFRADAPTTSRRPWLMGFFETTAIDIYVISTGPSTVSTKSRLAIILLGLFFVSFSSPRYGWCQGPLPKTHPPVPRGRRGRGRRWEGDGGRGEGQTKSSRRWEETHTSLCFHLSAWWTIILRTCPRRKKRWTFLHCDHKHPQIWVSWLFFNTI